MTKPALYFFPNSKKLVSPNPYARRLLSLLTKEFRVINESAPSSTGVLDALKWLFGMRVFFCGWLEEIPDRKGGSIQTAIAFFLIMVMRPLGIKLVWTLHNKTSHAASHQWQKSALFKLLAHRSDIIFTHAREGVAVAHALGLRHPDKVHFIHHPVDAFTARETGPLSPEVDVLVWGKMDRYKGVLEFLQALDDTGRADAYRILIWGRFADPAYFEQCQARSGPHTELRNAFIPDDELQDVQNRSRVILFPYLADSVLSSGALMTSLNSRAQILGPNTGAFADLAAERCILTFEDHETLAPTLDAALADQNADDILARREAFFQQNSWERAVQHMSEIIQSRSPAPGRDHRLQATLR